MSRLVNPPLSTETLSKADLVAILDLLNDGSSGSLTPASNTTLAPGIYRYNNVNIPAGVTVSLSSGNALVIISKNTVNIDGLLSVSGMGAIAITTNSTNWTNVSGTNGAGLCGSGGSGGATGNGSGKGGDTYFAGAPNVAGGNSGINGTDAYISKLPFNIEDLMLFMGAAGGSGGVNGSSYPAGKGGNGGGCIIIYAPSITGSGSIKADGTTGGNDPFGDNSGGGGGGGFILIITNNATSITATANGGSIGAGTKRGGAGGKGMVLKVVTK